MPDQDDESPAEETAAVETKPDPIADLKAQMAEMQAGFVGLQNENARLNGLAQGLMAGQKEPETKTDAFELIDQTKIVKMLEEGDFTGATQALERNADVKARREAHILKQTQIDPLADTINSTGIPIMAEHAGEITRLTLNAVDAKLYEKHKKQVDQVLSTLDPKNRLSKEAITSALDWVIGRNRGDYAEEIRKDERARVLAEMNGAPGARPGRVIGRGATPGASTALPSARELFGDGAAAEVQSKGGEDAWAQKRGYKDWEAYCTDNGLMEGSA